MLILLFIGLLRAYRGLKLDIQFGPQHIIENSLLRAYRGLKLEQVCLYRNGNSGLLRAYRGLKLDWLSSPPPRGRRFITCL